MQSHISFLRTRELPGPQGCLREKPLNLLHPLANYRGYSRSTVSVLERFVILNLTTQTRVRVKESMMPEKLWLFAQKGRNLKNLSSINHVLFQHTKRVAYKDGHCWGKCLEWGWSRSESDTWKPLWSTLQWASKVYQELCKAEWG